MHMGCVTWEDVGEGSMSKTNAEYLMQATPPNDSVTAFTTYWTGATCLEVQVNNMDCGERCRRFVEDLPSIPIK
jgi:hypothetical protein